MPFQAKAPPQARFYADGVVDAELIGEHIHLLYNPTTQAAQAIYDASLFIDNGSGQYIKVANTHDTLSLDLTGQMQRCYAAEVGAPFADPVTGADLTQVSLAGLMALIKVAYDIEVNAREAARLAALPPPEVPAP